MNSEGARLEGEGLNTTGTQSLLSIFAAFFTELELESLETYTTTHKQKAHRPSKRTGTYTHYLQCLTLKPAISLHVVCSFFPPQMMEDAM